MYHLHREQQLNCTLDEVWEFFSNPRNLDKLTPPSVGFKITHCQSGHMHEGQIIAYKIKVAPLTWVTWVTEITLVEDKKRFVDDQRVGPYALWHHSHRFEANEQGVYMIDDVSYALTFGPVGRIAHALYVKKQLQHIFDERHRLAEEIFNA